MSSWFTINRRLLESDEWLAEPFTRGQAWVDLIGLAAFKAGHKRINGARIEYQRGEYVAAERYLAQRWQWSRTKLRRFLDELKKDRKVDHRKTTFGTVIQVLNYDLYQSKKTADQTTEEPRKDHGKTTEKPNIRKNNVNNDNKGNKHSRSAKSASSDDGFVEWWSTYPLRAGKQTARSAYAKAIETIRGRSDGDGGDNPVAFLLDRAKLMQQAWQAVLEMDDAEQRKAKLQFCPHASTWLNQGRYDDDPTTWGPKVDQPSPAPQRVSQSESETMKYLARKQSDEALRADSQVRQSDLLGLRAPD